MDCSRPWIMRLKQLSTLMTVIQLWQITWGADPPPMVQKEVKVCFNCNESTADFNWLHQLKPFFRIQWKFKDIIMSSYTKTELNITQDTLSISQEYKGRFHLLQPGGVGFSLSSVTTADIGTYRCIILLETAFIETLEGVLEEIDRKDKVEVRTNGNAVFNWTLRKEQSFSHIQWQFNDTPFASTTQKGLSSDSLDISADYKPRLSLLHPGDVGFQLDHVSREDNGTYTCIITSQSGRFTIEGYLEVKDPPPAVQKKVKMCFHCNETTAYFNWTNSLKPFTRIQWKFEDMVMSSYTKTELNITQESLTITQEYKGRFHLLQPGGVGFSLSSVTTADIGTYRCIILLETAFIETLEGILEEIDRKDKVEVCTNGNAVFNWTLRKEQSFSLIQWQFNDTTFANTTKKGLSSDSLDISADYKARFSLLPQGDVGFQLDHVSREDTRTYTCIITSQSGEFTIEGDLEVKDQQSGNFTISVNRKQRTLTCGIWMESKYSWIFSTTTGRKNETSTGHELTLSSIPQKGSVYCQRDSDCTSSLPYSFSSGEVPEEGGIPTAAVIVPIVIIIIIIIIVIVILLYKRRRERERISRETGGGETVSGVEEQML